MAQMSNINDLVKIRNALIGKKICIITDDLTIETVEVDGSERVDDIIISGTFYMSEEDAIKMRDKMLPKEEVHHPNTPKIKFAACGCEAMFMDTD